MKAAQKRRLLHTSTQVEQVRACLLRQFPNIEYNNLDVNAYTDIYLELPGDQSVYGNIDF